MNFFKYEKKFKNLRIKNCLDIKIPFLIPYDQAYSKKREMIYFIAKRLF